MECIGELEIKIKPATTAENMGTIFSDLIGRLALLASEDHVLSSGPLHGHIESQTIEIPVRYSHDEATSNAFEYGLLVTEQAVAETTETHGVQYDIVRYRSITPQSDDFARYY